MCHMYWDLKVRDKQKIVDCSFIDAGFIPVGKKLSDYRNAAPGSLWWIQGNHAWRVVLQKVPLYTGLLQRQEFGGITSFFVELERMQGFSNR